MDIWLVSVNPPLREVFLDLFRKMQCITSYTILSKLFRFTQSLARRSSFSARTTIADLFVLFSFTDLFMFCSRTSKLHAQCKKKRTRRFEVVFRWVLWRTKYRRAYGRTSGRTDRQTVVKTNTQPDKKVDQDTTAGSRADRHLPAFRDRLALRELERETRNRKAGKQSQTSRGSRMGR